MSEEDYEQYLKWVVKRQADLKGDEIVAGPVLVPVLISLAVGALFTAVGTLLAPKPKPLSQEDRQVRNEQGDSEKGRSRFSPTFGFDSATQLSKYGEAIVIHFGESKTEAERTLVQSNWPISLEQLLCNPCTRYAASPNRSGGLLVSPSLVWSRMYSMGKSQMFQGMYVVGEQMETPREYDPDLSGIWIGNNTLDKLSDRNFAFYYDNEGNEGRLRSSDLREGTQGDKASGNPFVAPIIPGYRDWAEPFPTPVCDLDESSGFSMAYSLSNQSTFGCYDPIMNGTDRRPPWRVISLPSATDKEAEARIREERLKISGGQDRQEPSGRGYGRKMGLTTYNGQTGGEKENPRWQATVQRGDVVRFEIQKRRIPEDIYDEGVSVEDLVNESQADREAADDALQIGEEFMINSCRFRVIDRKAEAWELERTAVFIDLECIENPDPGSQIGFVSKDYFEQNICDEDSSVDIFARRHVPPHWSPLLKYESAGFRNIRKADVTEIGIKSRVWAQMNGMANFPATPTSNELRDKFDKKNVQYANGVQNQYFTRISFFKMYMRDPMQVEDSSDPSSWIDTNVVFAVRGNEPVDQYNFIRIKPAIQKQYEYRMYPLNSGWATQRNQNPATWNTDDVAWILDVAKGEEFSLVKTLGSIGQIEISGVGRLIGIRCAVTSPLMLGKKDSDYSDSSNSFCQDSWCEGFGGNLNITLTGSDSPTQGLGQKLDDTCEDDACATTLTRGARQSAFWNYLAERNEAPEAEADCVDCISAWATDAEISAMNYTRAECSKPYWGIWEYATQVNEGSYYSGLISRSSDNGAEHQIVYVNETKKPTEITQYPKFTMMGLTLRATREFNSLDQPRLYLKGGTGLTEAPLADQTLSSSTTQSAAVTRVAPAANRSTRAQPSTIGVRLTQDTDCADNDRRRIRVTANFIDETGSTDIDPGGSAARDSRWMVQWFEGKSRDDGRKLDNPQWVDTTVSKEWSGNPHAYTIEGNEAQILVPKASGFYTCYMWPAESDTENDSEIDDESGLNFGPKVNNDKTKSLALIVFDSNDQMEEVATAGIRERIAEATIGDKYESSYFYLWSGKQNYTARDRTNGRSVYWYIIDSGRAEVTVDLLAICAGDSLPGPGPDPDPDNPPPPPPPPDEPAGELLPSNNYADLIYWLLTDSAGVGDVVSTEMIDKDRMIITARFINRMGLTFDGTISDKTNMRTFASTTAPFYLCNFTVTNGKFTLWPVIPVDENGNYKGKKVFIKQLFTEGNIIDGSFKLDYLDADDRRPFKAAMRYRVMAEDQLPEERTLTSKWYTGQFSDPTEEFDMTQFCTTPEHAQLAARYFMWIRNVVTHSVTLQTVPEVMNGVGPGDFIKVKLETATIQRQNLAAVTAEGRIQSNDTWRDGTHEVAYWVAGMDEPGQRNITVVNGHVQERDMGMALMSQVRNEEGTDSAVATTYQVESVNLEDDGLVELVASYYPVDAEGVADLYNALFGLGRWSC